jgi:hypothetical protein
MTWTCHLLPTPAISPDTREWPTQHVGSAVREASNRGLMTFTLYTVQS